MFNNGSDYISINVLFQLLDPDLIGGPHPNKHFADFAQKDGQYFFREIFSEISELIVKCDKISEDYRNEGPIQFHQ